VYRLTEDIIKVRLRDAGLPVPEGGVARSPEEALSLAQKLGNHVVIKALIPIGRRGKAGAVKLVSTPDEAAQSAREMLGQTINGYVVETVYVEQQISIAKELYLSFSIEQFPPQVLVSSKGGVDIEETFRTNPDAVITVDVDPVAGLSEIEAQKIWQQALPGTDDVFVLAKITSKLFTFYQENDGITLEINPLVIDVQGSLIALDAKLSFDGNALFRQTDLLDLRDEDEEDPGEIRASEYGLSYISLDGDIGCLVNGAGLAMATMDIITLYGGAPANFLDVGGGAATEQVAKAFEIMLENRKLKAILVNIFGGIMRCDVVAQGLLDAARTVELELPVVVRLEGANVEQGRSLLANAGLNILTANSMDDAARKVVHAAGAYRVDSD